MRLEIRNLRISDSPVGLLAMVVVTRSSDIVELVGEPSLVGKIWHHIGR